MSLYSSSTENRSSLRRSMSVPHINLSLSTTTTSRADSALGYSGSCSDLDQLTQEQYNQYQEERNLRYRSTHHHRHRQHHRQEPKNGSRHVTDLRQLMTLRQHYYPEGGWGWLITGIGLIMQVIAHGLHMSVGVFVVEIMKTFRVSSIRAGEYKLSLCDGNISFAGRILHNRGFKSTQLQESKFISCIETLPINFSGFNTLLCLEIEKLPSDNNEALKLSKLI